MTRWQDREHRSHCSGRHGSCGWEFDTRAQAIDYINDQYGKIARPEFARDFACEVESNGVRVRFSAYGVVHTATYVKGETMRDTHAVPSPSDCTWIVPGSDAMEYCNYYR